MDWKTEERMLGKKEVLPKLSFGQSSFLNEASLFGYIDFSFVHMAFGLCRNKYRFHYVTIQLFVNKLTHQYF